MGMLDHAQASLVTAGNLKVNVTATCMIMNVDGKLHNSTKKLSKVRTAFTE